MSDTRYKIEKVGGLWTVFSIEPCGLNFMKTYRVASKNKSGAEKQLERIKAYDEERERNRRARRFA